MKKVILFFMAGLLSLGCFGQSRSARKAIQQGNDLYQAGKYDSAQQQYKKGLELAPESFKGYFNLGDALFQKESYEAARKAFNSGIRATDDQLLQAKAYHNIGNTFLKQKKWEQAIGAFKNALRRNGQDTNTKYNLAYAQKMLRKSRQQKDQKNQKNQKDQKNQKNQKNSQEQHKKNQQPKEQQKNQSRRKDGGQKKKPSDPRGHQPGEKPENRQSGHRQPMPSKLTRQEAENLLNALNQEEKSLHRKQKKETGVPVQLEKDW